MAQQVFAYIIHKNGVVDDTTGREKERYKIPPLK